MPKPLLRRLDQLAIAALALVAIFGVVSWLVVQHSGRHGLVDIEQAGPLRYQYLVDINSATWPELAQLPGIGEVLARRIVESRKADGPYRVDDDLLRVEGIGPRKLAQMQKHLAPMVDSSTVAER